MKERHDLKPCPFCGTMLVEAPLHSYSRLEIDGLAVGCPECDWWFEDVDAQAHGMTLDEYVNRRTE